ncbi:glycosyltransferase [Zunongwangia sp. F260]|uniref:Glycosyltransferase n=1 Tax=Autumnicola lenta TaxID=3075593 RepID=A0ABU3CG20_9FLAO|nr:glycosyltransferase [Zunongwangia sp. F260]MDT0645303.1 glycosyltransferase [Zunongwangia sp. F260]
MTCSLIICTYQRPKAVLELLNSVEQQRLYPDQILIIDGSIDAATKECVKQRKFKNLEYFKVTEQERGLTRQRNYGIGKTAKGVEILCFLDDDIILENDYFEKLVTTYSVYPKAIGVGGYITNEVSWEKNKNAPNFEEFKMDGHIRKLGSRNLLRKKLSLLSNQPPGVMPEFSNGLSIGFLPPSGKVYPVEFFMGGVASYRKSLFKKMSFSEYFDGYGLYEDMDFCLRASKVGQLYVNTAARVAHFHEQAGRPDKFKYGKMVIRNGWYVWRIKYPRPDLNARLKWHGTAFLLTLVRLGNVITTQNRKEAFTESLGRIAGWWSLLLNRPTHEV